MALSFGYLLPTRERVMEGRPEASSLLELADRHIDSYLSNYYGVAAAGIRKAQANFAGSEAGAIEWLQGFIDAGAEHLVIRLAGDHERQMESLVRIREALMSANTAR